MIALTALPRGDARPKGEVMGSGVKPNSLKYYNFNRLLDTKLPASRPQQELAPGSRSHTIVVPASMATLYVCKYSPNTA